MSSSLADYYRAAGISDFPAWAEGVPIVINGEARAPYRHQVTGLNLACYFDRAGLYDETGAGKSIPSQAYAIWHAGLGNKVIVLMGPSLLVQYQRSLEGTFPGVSEHLKIGVYRGTPERRRKLTAEYEARGYPDILLMSYHIFRKLFTLLREYYSVLVCDEAQILKNPESGFHQAVTQFLGPVGERGLLLMTGTPHENELVDLYGYIKLITPHLYSGIREFYRIHCRVRDVKVYVKGRDRPIITEEIYEYQNLDLLNANFYAQARRVTKDQVIELPEKQIIRFPVELSATHKKRYKDFYKEKILELDGGRLLDPTTESAAIAMARRLVSLPNQFGITENAMLDALDGLIESIGVGPKNKLIVFGYFNDTIEMLTEHLRRFNPAQLYGKTLNRQREVDKFLNDPSCQVFVANIDSGGVGLNLQGVCAYSIFYEGTGVPGKVLQAIDRIHRPGQKRKVTVYLLDAIGTVTRDIWNTALDKSTVSNKVMKDESALKDSLHTHKRKLGGEPLKSDTHAVQ